MATESAQIQQYELKVKPGEILKSLNPLQQAKAEEIRDYWLNYVFSCTAKLDEEQARIGINNLYQLAGYEQPQTIFVGSPAACQEVANHLTVLYRHLSHISEEDFQKTCKATIHKVLDTIQVAKELFAENPESTLAQLEALVTAPSLPAEEQVVDAVVVDLTDKLGNVFDIKLS